MKLNPGLSWQNSIQQKRGSFHPQTGLQLSKCYIWSIAFYGAETWTLRKVDQEFLQSFKICCWRWMEKIGCTSNVRNEEVLQRAKEEMNILRTIKLRRANWIGYILHTNCPLTRYWRKLPSRRTTRDRLSVTAYSICYQLPSICGGRLLHLLHEDAPGLGDYHGQV